MTKNFGDQLKKSVSSQSVEMYITPTEETPTGKLTHKNEAPEGYKLNPLYIEKIDRRVQLLLTDTMHQQVKELARKQGLNFSEYVRMILQEHIDEVVKDGN